MFKPGVLRAAIVLLVSLFWLPLSASAVVLDVAADAYIQRDAANSPHNGGNVAVKGESGRSGKERVGFLRFDTLTVTNEILDAKLLLNINEVDNNTTNNPNPFTFRLRGINEGQADETFDDATLTKNSSSIADDSDNMLNESLTTALGDFQLRDTVDDGTTFEFSSTALLDFLNADTNGNVAFTLERITSDTGASTFFARESTTGGSQLSLTVESAVIPEPSTVLIWSLLAVLGITAGWYRGRKG